MYIPCMIEDHMEKCPICRFKNPNFCEKFIELMNEHGWMIKNERI